MYSLPKTAAILWCFSIVIVAREPRVIVNIAEPSVGELRHFWDSTGLCPPAPRSVVARFLLAEDERFNLALIGSLPHQSLSQVRIHWLLDLITVSHLDDSGTPLYNFTLLDQLFDWMQIYRLNPGFELMGNPSHLFRDFNNDTQVEMWRHLVRQVASRYIDRYGLSTVEQWRFETWNEPDLKSYNILNFTVESYMRYFEASSGGLRDAGHGRLRFGGPAGLFKTLEKHPLCWGLLQHCANQTACSLDFISFHKKGAASSAAVLEQGLQFARDLSVMFPSLGRIPLANDEADPLTGWSKSEPWRADVRYGAMVAAVIADHQHVMVRQQGLPLQLLSNDNAFLNYHPYYFTQRTLLARFQMNETNPPHVQFIRKPVYTTMALLSFLGNQELRMVVKNPDYRLSVLAAGSSGIDPWTGSVLLVFNNDTGSHPDEILNVTLRVLNVPGESPRYVLYLMDNVLTNPAQMWLRNGAPVFPEQQLRARIRAVEGPHRARGPTRVPHSEKLRLSVPLKLPSVGLLHICAKAMQGPGHVSRLMVCNVTYNEVMLFWSDVTVVTRCIKTYEVEFNSVVSDKFRRVNSQDTIFLSYQYAVPSDGTQGERVIGSYRVRAVDYWNRPGPFSLSVHYPGNFSCA
ncbi:alpha-L-iduronidase isoform X2 [Zootermopsis nevadensis]|uniref:alpha-L-iduronidase isoform X2 n=1 Tax=Zootermopsis nevadensis TaxID=136037 RepID=UPI000B8E36C3|nr:alpha-L-iduronidase isoform X2 [Zootermopsis nevadensis]